MPNANAPGVVPLRSALVCDILDSLRVGPRALGPEIAPLIHGVALVGPAFTARSVEVAEAPRRPYAGLLRALDAVGKGEVFVLATGRTERSAMWGELLSHACLARGALGTVTDGYTRDSEQIRALRYPLFARGILPLDIHGRSEVADFGSPVVIHGVEVAPGDLIVADSDGVVVVPGHLTDIVIERAATKAGHEDSFRDAVREGVLPSEAYERYRVL